MRFHQAITTAGAHHHTFIEISPHPLLTHAITDTLQHAHTLPTLQRDTDDTITFHTNLNATHTSRPPDTPHPSEPHPLLPTTPWQHTSHWISATSAASHDANAHPLLGTGVIDPTNGTRVWQTKLGPDLLWLGDHCVDDVCVLPGAAYAEIAVAAANEAFGAFGTQADRSWMIRELSLEQLMHIADDTVLVTTLTGDEQLCRVEMRTRSATSGWIKHAAATVTPASHAAPMGSTPRPADEVVTEMQADDLYQRLRAAGQQHGPAFQGITGLTVAPSGAATAQVRLPAKAKAGSRKFLLHPVMMDVALQTLGATGLASELAAGAGDQRATVLPVRFAGIHVYGDISDGARAIATLATTDSPDRLVGHVLLTDAEDRPLLEIDEVDMAVLQSRGGAAELGNRLFTLDWEPAALEKSAAPAGAAGAVLLIGDPDDADPLLAGLQSALRERTTHCELVARDDDQSIRAAITTSDTGWAGIVVVCPPRAVDELQPVPTQLELARRRTLQLAEIVKTVSRMGARNSPRLWVITRGARQLHPAEPVTLAQTQLRGLARVLTFEHPELKTSIVDIDPDGSEPLSDLVDELLTGADQDEVALRGGRRYVSRLVAAPVTPSGELAIESRETTVDLDTGAVRLELDQVGRLDGLKVHAVKRIRPTGDQVEVRITAAALNFSDVLKVMGVYPGLGGNAPIIGGECAGLVTAIGSPLESGLEIGQRVIAFGAGTIGSHLTTSQDLVVPIPDALSDSEAAAFGVAYLTAWHSLCEVGRLGPGERVLIHSATGGVGLAAMSIATMIGARIYATAGTDAKRAMLSGMGVEYVGDSRGVTFADEILDLTDGAGVDIVLNSLPGEAIRAGMRVLAPGGRFIELGKKDVFADASVGLAALARSGTFAVVDVDLNMRLQPKRYREYLQRILRHAAAGELTPLPVTEFAFADAIDAFRLMASGGHTGKIVIAIPQSGSITALAPRPAQPLVSPDGGYLVVGGMGGLGLVTARWLAQQGAGLVVVNGRSAPGAEVLAEIDAIRADGGRVEVVTGDIADPETARRLVAAVEDGDFRLAGVVHSAMVLADETVLNISESAATRVFGPKVAGGWWLHEATAHADLDWWLTYSSAASLIGSPGQGTYAAANSWIDGLVAYRRSLGLPAAGINWGPWAEVGRAQFFADLGISMISSAEGLAAVQLVLTADRARTGVFSLDARQWFQSFPAAAGSSLFAKLQDSIRVERRGGGRVRVELEACDPAERPGRLADAIADEIRAVLRSTEPIEHDRPLESFGLDSLMALELRNRLESSLGTTLPVALVWAYPTITDLAGAMCERLGYTVPAEDQQPPDEEIELSDEELDLLSDLVAASELEAATGGVEQ